MFQRRALLVFALSAALLPQAKSCGTALGQTPNNPPTLRDTLAKGLKARRPREFQFIDRVVAMVQNKQLPLDLVQSTFQWARKKTRFKRYPFQYFERGLIQRAAKIGIIIPPA